MLKKLLLMLSVLSSNLLIEGCATSPPDIPACVEINMAKGYCINTISAKEYVVDTEHPFEGKSWWEMRPTMIMLPQTSWAELKTYIITQCKQNGTCDQAVADWERTIQSIDSAIQNK